MSRQRTGPAAQAEVRREVRYEGRVQGVGFRFTAQRIATTFRVSGYVMNLADGRVQLVAEGSADEVHRFLDRVHAEMGHHIHGIQTLDLAATQEFDGFEIRH